MLFRSGHGDRPAVGKTGDPTRARASAPERVGATSWTAACQASLSFTVSWSLLKLMSIESVIPCNHLILAHSLLLLPSVFPSIGVFSSELALLILWPNYLSLTSFPTGKLGATGKEGFPIFNGTMATRIGHCQ